MNPVTCVDVTRASHRNARLSTILGVGAIVLMLAGCAGAKVTDVASAMPSLAPPSEVFVAAGAAPTRQHSRAAIADKVAANLQSELVKRLTKNGIRAEPYRPGTIYPGAAVLEVTVLDADPGNMAERFMIGFGLGKAKLLVKADLVNGETAGSSSEVAFNTSSDSGIKPGLILPGGIALATGNAIHLAVGGAIDVATNINGGLSRPTARTATAIIGQLKTYYASVGWQWPAGRA
jgi:hypothetical protein